VAQFNSISLNACNKVILTITNEGKLVAGPGLSTEEATVQFFQHLAAYGPSVFRDLQVRAEKAERELAQAREENAKMLAAIVNAPKAVVAEMDRRDAARAGDLSNQITGSGAAVQEMGNFPARKGGTT
jgi:hypothetical protein